jgi:hypothetical protein
MAALNLTVLVRSVNDCIEVANSPNKFGTVATCDLTPDQSIKAMLTLATSMGMLGFKMARALLRSAALIVLASQRLPVQAHFVVLQFKWEEAKLLQSERDALIKELESSLSPEIVDQVSWSLRGPRPLYVASVRAGPMCAD